MKVRSMTCPFCGTNLKGSIIQGLATTTYKVWECKTCKVKITKQDEE